MDRRSKKKGSRRPRKSGRTTVVAPKRTIPRVLPNHFDTMMTYTASQVVANNAQTRASKEWQVNDAYDFDAAFGTSYPVGFLEWAAMYKFYRCFAVDVKLKVSNREDFPLVLTTLLSNLSSPSVIDLSLQNGNPYSKCLQMSAKYGKSDCLTIHHRNIPFDRFIGDRYFWTDPNYAATNTTSPVNKIFFGMSISSGGTGSTLPLGVLVTAEFQVHVRWTERVALSTDATTKAMDERRATPACPPVSS